MTRQTPMAATLWQSNSMLRDAALIVGVSMIVAMAAQISVPMFPVPMTLQTLAILFVGLSLGAWRGAAALALYLAEGAMGLPVFANGMNGAALFGPTAGFLYGFVAMAGIAGFMAERVSGQTLVGLLIAGFVANVALYVPGVLYLNAATGLDFNGAVAAGMTPFIIGDLVKLVIAALIVTAGFKIARR